MLIVFLFTGQGRASDEVRDLAQRKPLIGEKQKITNIAALMRAKENNVGTITVKVVFVGAVITSKKDNKEQSRRAAVIKDRSAEAKLQLWGPHSSTVS